MTSTLPMTITHTLDDGREVTADVILDLENATITQVGGEGEIDANDNELIQLMTMLAASQDFTDNVTTEEDWEEEE